jgi:hypothetical protein
VNDEGRDRKEEGDELAPVRTRGRRGPRQEVVNSRMRAERSAEPPPDRAWDVAVIGAGPGKENEEGGRLNDERPGSPFVLSGKCCLRLARDA